MVVSFGIAGVGLGFGLNYVEVNRNIVNNEKMSNSILISTFIQDIGKDDFIKQSDFDKSFKLLDSFGEPIIQYSELTINEAYINNYFHFSVPQKVKFYSDKYGIEVYIKKYNPENNDNNVNIYPSPFNSSTPEFKIWFGKGSGDNRVESFIRISGAGFYGFKKTTEENDVKGAIKLFRNKISLKKDKNLFYDDKGVILPGVFAKNIKAEDIVSNMTKAELNDVEWKITSLSQDNAIPTKLIINIDFNKGILNNNYYGQTYQKFEIDGFDVEFGIDDYKSKVQNFINDEKNKTGMSEALRFKGVDSEIGTVLESYEGGLFSLEVPTLFKNRATNAGVEYIFKDWVDASSNSAFPSERDSKIPSFKIYVRSGVGTPFEYEEFFVVEGRGQVTNTPFKITQEDDIMTKIKRTTITDPFKDKIALTLEGEFLGVLQSKITASIVANVIKPEKNIALTVANDIVFPDDIVLGTNKIIATPVEVSTKGDNLNVKVSLSIGEEFKNRASFEKNIEFKGFETKNSYNARLINEFIVAIKASTDANKDFIISTKNPITKDNIDDVKRSISYYFNESVFVGFDSIMNNYKWSEKPLFKINFQKTSINEHNIISFWIEIVFDSVLTNHYIIIERSIESFY